jgi:hypothetical protein
MTPLACALAFAVLAATLSPVRAAETPEQAAKKVAEATKAADWKAFAALFHPEALADLKRLLRDLTAEETTRDMAKMFLDVSTPEELDKLSGEQVFERFMGKISAKVPGFGDALKSADIQILGHIEEKPDLAYVVSRNTIKVGEAKITKMEVISLRKQGDSWKALLSGSLEGVVEQLRVRAKKKPGGEG